MKTLQEFRLDCLSKDYPIMPDETLESILLDIKEGDRVLEVGTCVGYSARYLSEHRDIQMVTLERDPVRAQQAKDNLKTFDRIEFIETDALEYTPQGTFDVLIIDAAKAQNQKFLDRFVPFLKEDGIIFIDNIFFHGLVENPESVKTQKNLYKMVLKLKVFLDSIMQDERFVSESISVGDGLLKLKFK